MIPYWEDGILRFGAPMPSHYGMIGRLFDQVGDGSRITVPIAGILDDPTDEANIIQGAWFVLSPFPSWNWPPAQCNAQVVSSPVYDSVQDTVSMELSADPGFSISVQSRLVTLHPHARDQLTGEWPALLCDCIYVLDVAADPHASASVELHFYDSTGTVEVGTPGVAKTGTLTSSWTPNTSWVNLTPPTHACYVAARLTFGVDAGGAARRTGRFREPALGFVGGDIENVTSRNFATRYISAYV